MKTPRVGIFRFELGLASETFIPEQANSLQRYRASFWGRQFSGARWAGNPSHICDRFGSKVGKLFAAWPSDVFFKERAELRKSDLIHAHFGPDACFALPIAQRNALPLVTTFHGYDVLTSRERLAALGGFRVRRYLAHEAELKRNGAKFIAVSKFVAAALKRLGYPEDRIEQHYIGVDINRFLPMEERSKANQKRYLLSVARHVDFKGIDTLLKAFAKLAKKDPEAMLVQVGTGPLLERNKLLAKELGIDTQVQFLGRQPHERVRELMAGALAFCGPSQTAEDGGGEALGIVFCEASASGVPVVATRHGGIPEIVVDGETGLLVHEKDAEALGDALMAVWLDDSLSLAMGRAGRLRMETYFDISKQGPELEKIYDRAVARGAI